MLQPTADTVFHCMRLADWHVMLLVSGMFSLHPRSVQALRIQGCTSQLFCLNGPCVIELIFFSFFSSCLSHYVLKWVNVEVPSIPHCHTSYFLFPVSRLCIHHVFCVNTDGPSSVSSNDCAIKLKSIFLILPLAIFLVLFCVTGPHVYFRHV